MTALDRFERRLGDALEDLASPQFPDYFDDVLAQAVSRRQRPAWTFPERWIPMSSVAQRPVLVPGVPWRTVSILLMLVALLVASAVISIGLRQDRSPAPPFGPAANGVVAVVSDFDIYGRDVATGEHKLLVGGPTLDVFPMFSRDGLSLAWARLESASDTGSEPATLMVANADGTDARALIGPISFDWASWSPDASELAMISRGSDGTRVLSTVDVATGEQAVIETPVEPRDWVDWRPPDGGELIFSARDGERRAIYGVGSDGSGFRQISPLSGSYAFLGPFDISADGSRMIFTRGGSDQTRVITLDLETGDEQAFGTGLPPLAGATPTDESQAAPLISPDGKWILFDRFYGRSPDTVTHQLYLASADGDGADAVPVGPVHRTQSVFTPYYFAFSPDGQTVVVHAQGTGETWMADVDGGEAEQVAWGQVDDIFNWQRRAP